MTSLLDRYVTAWDLALHLAPRCRGKLAVLGGGGLDRCQRAAVCGLLAASGAVTALFTEEPLDGAETVELAAVRPMAEQLLIQNTGTLVKPGDVVTVRVDEAVLHDIYAPYIFQQFRDMGFDRVYDPDKVSVMVDHLYPTCIDDDPRCFRYSRRFQDEYGVKRLCVGEGISHQLALEQGIAKPGKVVFGTHNRNFIGRMGSPQARTFLASPAAAASAALEGKITHPGKYL